MNFSSIFFLNLVNLQLSVGKERMLLHSTYLTFGLDCVFSLKFLFSGSDTTRFQIFFVFRNLPAFHVF